MCRRHAQKHRDRVLSSGGNTEKSILVKISGRDCVGKTVRDVIQEIRSKSSVALAKEDVQEIVGIAA